jgi:hypothetical protein
MASKVLALANPGSASNTRSANAQASSRCDALMLALALVWMFVRSRLLCSAQALQQCTMVDDLRAAAAAAAPAGGSSIAGADVAVAAAVVIITGNDCFPSGCALLLSLPAPCCQVFWLKPSQPTLRRQIVNTSHQLSNLCLSAMNLRTMAMRTNTF